MDHYKDIERFIHYVDTNLSLPKYKKQLGGGNDTVSQPYSTFENLSDKMFEYFKYIYDNNEKNKQEYEESIDNLDQPCDCEKYKCNYKSNKYEDEDEEQVLEKPIIIPENIEENVLVEPKKHSILLLKNENL